MDQNIQQLLNEDNVNSNIRLVYICSICCVEDQSIISRSLMQRVKINTGCFKKSFTMVFQMLLCGECYKNVYT
jgi:hypothetical protein